MKKIVYIMLAIPLIAIMAISGIFLLKELKQNKEQEEIFENLIEIIESETEEGKEQKYQDLFNINQDMVAWIKIDGTNINYPIMQTLDKPNYYLRRNFYKEYSVYGTPYIAQQCNLEISDNIIIHGHNIRGNKMFGELEKYKSKNFYEEHKIIEFYTKNNKLQYEVISVFKTIPNNGFDYYKYYNFIEEREFETFIKKCQELSFYNTEISTKYGDKLLTLSTCEYSNKNGRLVVIAKKLKNY